MTAPMLILGPEIRWPRDAVTESFVILGKRRGGKSNTAVVMAEEMHDAGLPWVAFDAKGDWYGIRSSADGDGPGLPIPVFGGLHGDLPLSYTAGALIADLIFDHNLTCVLDVSRFTDPQLARFSTDFTRRLYERHQADPTPRHVFAEEADRYMPQSLRRGQDDMAASVEAWSLMIRLGGAFGLGVTLISQRAARLNNDGMTQAETMVAHRTTAPPDIDVIVKWMRHHHVNATITDSLPGMDNGEAWVSSSHWLVEHGQEPLQRAQFRHRRTFDSGATPKVGEIRQPKRLADVDLERLRGQLTEVVAQAEANDPAALRRKLAETETKLRAALRRTSEDAPELERRAQAIYQLRADLELARAAAAEPDRVPVFADGDVAGLERAAQVIADAISAARELSHARPASSAPARPPLAEVVARAPRYDPPPLADPPAADGLPALKAGARKMLATLCQHYPMRLTRRQLGALTQFSARGGTFRDYLSVLRRHGFVTEDGDFLIPTQAAFDYTGTHPDAPVGPDELRATWQRVLKTGQWLMLAALLEAYPGTLTRDELGAVAGFEPAGGTFRDYLSVLRRNDLATESRDGIRAADVFFLQGATHA